MFRNVVLNAAAEIGLEILESESISPEEVSQVNEIFFVSEEKGMQWVKGIKSKRFLNTRTQKIHEKLNAIWKDKVS